MTNISRRTALARIAAAPAALAVGAVPALAEHQTANLRFDRADAELVRLGAEFDRLHEEWLPLWREMNRLHHLWTKAIDARGLSFDRDLEAILALDVELGGDAACDRSDEHLEQLGAVASRIRAIRPASLAGLAVHARVCRFDCLNVPTLEEPREQWDLEFARLHDFLAEIESLAAKGGAA